MTAILHTPSARQVYALGFAVFAFCIVTALFDHWVGMNYLSGFASCCALWNAFNVHSLYVTLRKLRRQAEEMNEARKQAALAH